MPWQGVAFDPKNPPEHGGAGHHRAAWFPASGAPSGPFDLASGDVASGPCPRGASGRIGARPGMFSTELSAQTLLSGVLMGLIFSLVAVGGSPSSGGSWTSSNFAHGDFLMSGMYISYWMYVLWGSILLSLPRPGILLRHGNDRVPAGDPRILGAPMLIQIFATFGMMILMRYVAFYFFKPNYRSIQQTLLSGNIDLRGVYLSIRAGRRRRGVPHDGAVYADPQDLVGGALQATAEDREAAALMGIDTDRMFTLAWGSARRPPGSPGRSCRLSSTFSPKLGDLLG